MVKENLLHQNYSKRMSYCDQTEKKELCEVNIQSESNHKDKHTVMRNIHKHLHTKAGMVVLQLNCKIMLKMLYSSQSLRKYQSTSVLIRKKKETLKVFI